MINASELLTEQIRPQVEQKLQLYSSNPLIKFAHETMSQLDTSIFSYHNITHLRTVEHNALSLWELANKDNRDMDESLRSRLERNLVVAAAFHDLGFTNAEPDAPTPAAGHEQRSVELFRQHLDELPGDLKAQFSIEDIAMISGAIMATKLELVDGELRQPSIDPTINPIAAYLQDADVGNFGQTSFKLTNSQVREEELALKKRHAILSREIVLEPSKLERLEQIKNFLIFTRDVLLKPHEWKTVVAQVLWPLKVRNIAWVSDQIVATNSEIAKIALEQNDLVAPGSGSRRAS